MTRFATYSLSRNPSYGTVPLFRLLAQTRWGQRIHSPSQEKLPFHYWPTLPCAYIISRQITLRVLWGLLLADIERWQTFIQESSPGSMSPQSTATKFRRTSLCNKLKAFSISLVRGQGITDHRSSSWAIRAIKRHSEAISMTLIIIHKLILDEIQNDKLKN